MLWEAALLSKRRLTFIIDGLENDAEDVPFPPNG
jgi:hypothetical protein